MVERGQRAIAFGQHRGSRISRAIRSWKTCRHARPSASRTAGQACSAISAGAARCFRCGRPFGATAIRRQLDSAGGLRRRMAILWSARWKFRSRVCSTSNGPHRYGRRPKGPGQPLDLPAAARPNCARPAGREATGCRSGRGNGGSPASLREGGRWALALATERPQVLRIENVGRTRIGSQINQGTSVHAIYRPPWWVGSGGDDGIFAFDSLPQSIVVVVPAWMSVVSVECDDQALSWRVVAQSPGEPHRVEIDLPTSKGNRFA